MAKRTKSHTAHHAEVTSMEDSLFSSSKQFDPTLASLFASSTTSQPVAKFKSGVNSKLAIAKPSEPKESESSDGGEEQDSSRESESESDHSSSESEDDESSSVSFEEDEESALEEAEGHVESSDQEVSQEAQEELEDTNAKSRRKRKREDEDIESKYLQRLAQEAAREDAKRQEERQSKRHKATEASASAAHDVNGSQNGQDPEVEEEDAGSGEDEVYEIPQHESVTTSQTPDIEKANRTVFLGNVSSEAVTSKKAKKALIQHMSSFFESLQKGDSTHKIDSIRFRSTAYTNMLPKKASYVTQDLMESTTRSTNAYIVYTTKAAARGALKLNGTIVLGRHLRVDSVAHPTKTDPKRCIFVGNLGFVDDESAIQAAEDVEGKEKRKSKKNKKKEPSDIEEGLWREFGKCGTVENVRVVRDSKTRVGKGFAYVQFTDENAVEAALLYDGKKFPPMLPRKLRVMRAKSIKRNTPKKDTWSRPATNGVYNPKISGQQKSTIGRASKLLGRAGAALINRAEKPTRDPGKTNGLKTPESFVFEGHRATSGSYVGNKKRTSKQRKGKPENRSARRAMAWKYGEGK